MKKNKMMRAASFLLVAVLLTTSVISGTFAKYVTSANATDSARVAKWGVEINTTDYDMFDENYNTDANTFGYTAQYSVSAGEDVVAPGTTKALNMTDITGVPEVAVNVKYEAVLTLTNWEVDGDEYCPIVFNVGGETYGTDDTGATHKSADIAALKTAVETAIAASSANYEPGENLSTTATSPEVTWSWAYEGDDAKDTALGDVAADGNAATISLKVTTTVTQID